MAPVPLHPVPLPLCSVAALPPAPSPLRMPLCPWRPCYARSLCPCAFRPAPIPWPRSPGAHAVSCPDGTVLNSFRIVLAQDPALASAAIGTTAGANNPTTQNRAVAVENRLPPGTADSRLQRCSCPHLPLRQGCKRSVPRHQQPRSRGLVAKRGLHGQLQPANAHGLQDLRQRLGRGRRRRSATCACGRVPHVPAAFARGHGVECDLYDPGGGRLGPRVWGGHHGVR